MLVVETSSNSDQWFSNSTSRRCGMSIKFLKDRLCVKYFLFLYFNVFSLIHFIKLRKTDCNVKNNAIATLMSFNYGRCVAISNNLLGTTHTLKV